MGRRKEDEVVQPKDDLTSPVLQSFLVAFRLDMLMAEAVVTDEAVHFRSVLPLVAEIYPLPPRPPPMDLGDEGANECEHVRVYEREYGHDAVLEQQGLPFAS